jgi:rod shape-determining protein MreC
MGQSLRCAGNFKKRLYATSKVFNSEITMQFKRSVLVILAFFCMSIISGLYYYEGSFKVFSTISGLCVYPILRLSSVVSDCHAWYTERVRTVNDLTSRCKELDKERCFFREKYIQLQSYQWYRQDVDQSLEKIKSLYVLDTVRIGQVLTRHFSSQEHYFFVDQGSYDGISQDMIAFSDSCLIGRVTDVFPTYCKVLLVTDMRCSIPVLCGEKKIAGVLQGSNQALLTIKYVDHLQPIFENDLVITSGIGFIFPYGIGIGTVQAVDTDHVHKHITVKPFLDYKEIRHCFLIKKNELRFN